MNFRVVPLGIIHSGDVLQGLRITVRSTVRVPVGESESYHRSPQWVLHTVYFTGQYSSSCMLTSTLLPEKWSVATANLTEVLLFLNPFPVGTDTCRVTLLFPAVWCYLSNISPGKCTTLCAAFAHPVLACECNCMWSISTLK